MASCPNTNLDSWKQLVEDKGEDAAYFLWDKYDGDVPVTSTEAQLAVKDKLFQTKKEVKKVTLDKKETDPLLLDSEEANNGYEVQDAEGNWAPILKRVTNRVKAWYKQKFGNKVFTPQEKAFNELKRDYGIAGHNDFQEIHERYFYPDGTKREAALPRPAEFNLPSLDMYEKLERYYVDLINSLPGANIYSEVVIYDKKNKEAGTIDMLAIDKDGKAHILDWKFMYIGGNDVAWFKQGAFNIQIGTYKTILRENYGIKDFGMLRAIPIAMDFQLKDRQNPSEGYRLDGIAIGSVDKSQIDPINDLKLIPVSEETESTGFVALDRVLDKLNALYREYGKEQVTNEEERQFKIERLNQLRKAIRIVQGTNNLKPLIDVIEVMRKDGDRILNDYNAIYKDRPATSEDSNNADLSDFADDMNNYIRFSEVFSTISDDIGDLIWNAEMEAAAESDAEKENIKLRKDILFNLENESKQIRKSIKQITEASQDFAKKHIGERNLVAGLTKAEAVVKGLASLFRGVSELPLRSLQILYKLTRSAQGKASQDALVEVEELMAIRKKLADKGGDLRKLVQKIYQKDDKGGLVNKLVKKFDSQFYEDVDVHASAGGDKAWLEDNIDMDAYRAEAKQVLERQIKKIENNSYAGTEEEVARQKERLIVEATRLYDIDNKDFNGWNNYIIKRHPQEKWFSQDYKDIQSDPDLLDLYNYIQKINSKANDIGYIDNMVAKNFLPFVRKSLAEQLVWDNKLPVMSNFYNSLQIRTDDAGYGKINEVTGELENSIPKYYTTDFTKTEEGPNDYSDVSEDLFKNMILYVQQVNKYKYMSEVEGQLKLVKTIEALKGHLNTNRVGNVVREGGKVEELPGNEENTKMYDQFLRALLYEQKYVINDSDVPLNIDKVLNFVKRGLNRMAGREIYKESDATTATSLVKTIDAANRAFQLKTLGFEFISGAANMFGGNIQIATQAGNYFKAREFLKNETKLIGQNFENEEDKEAFVQLVNTFMPLKDDPAYEEYKKAGMSALTRQSLGDTLMVFMRAPEQLIEKSVFITLLENVMVVDGKIVSIREHVKNKYKDRYKSAEAYKDAKANMEKEIADLKKTEAIAVTRKIEDGKLVIPGLDLTNRDELQRLTNLTRRISRNATGGLSDGDINRMSMSIWTKSMMLFKNWIPKLTDTRFSEFRKVSDDFSVRINEDGIPEGEKYDIGRIRLLMSVIASSFQDRSANLMNIIQMNDAGIKKLDQMYEEYRDKYETETGEVLTMTKEEFIDMIRTNLHNQLKELAMLGALISSMLALKMVPDDDKDKAAKNFHRYSIKVLDKFVNELSFFYNPINYEQLLSGSMFPALGIVTDMSKFVGHLASEITGFDFDPNTSAEDVRKKSHPLKYGMKALPITKSLVTWISILNSDFAKDNDVTIQAQNNIR
jgi:hypothetical protein